MSSLPPGVIAEHRSRLVPNRPGDTPVAIPRHMPGVVIFLHGVNDPGAAYESVETGLCQGVNERLDRADLKAQKYGGDFSNANKTPADEQTEKLKDVLDDPDTYLYQRTPPSSSTRSLFIPFYWGYRAAPDEIKRDPNGDPSKFRTQYQDLFDNRLDRHFAKGGGFFANATNNLLAMFGEGDSNAMRHVANLGLKKPLYMGENPQRRYFVLAAHRLAMLVSEIRRVSPNETITIMGHSQGTLITLLAQALLVDRGERCADCAIMVASPYSVLPDKTPAGSNTLDTLINIVKAVTAAPHVEPPLSALQFGQPGYGGRTGRQWSPEQGQRLGTNQSTVVFPERDNRGKVYLYFSPDDTTVGLAPVSGIGTFGVPPHLPDGKPAMAAMPAGFFQRMWTTRVRHEKPVLVGAEPALTLLRVYGERRTAQHSDLDALAQNSMDLAEKRYINGEALTPPHEPQMYGGEAITGSPTTAGIDRPDAVSLNTALANPTASFQWVEVRESTTALDPEQERVRWNQGKHLDDQTQKMQQTVVQGNPMLGTPDQYTLTREETANEIRARMTVDQNEWDNNSYHSAILRSPENHRWVTAMDIAIGQARCLDDPQMREVLTAIADWKMTKVGFKALTEMPSWSKLSAEAQALVKSNYLYYDEGTFPSDLVPMTPPPLAFVMSKQGEAS